MTQPKVLDLDKQLGFDAEFPMHIKNMTVLGMKVRVVCDLNSFGLAEVTAGNGEMGDVMRFLQSMIHPDDWVEFHNRAALHPAMRGEEGAANMMKMIQAITEAASERPTAPPSDLPRGGSTRSTGVKSAASTGTARAKASKTSR